MAVAHFASCGSLLWASLCALVGATRIHLAHLESIGNHVSIEPFTPGNVDQFEGLDLACYCKKVKDMSECLDKDDVHNPAGPHFSHNGGELCCKVASISTFSWKGFKYEQQENMMLCMAETRAVPVDSCCRLQDAPGSEDARGSVGVRISKAYSSNQVVKGWHSDFGGWQDLDKKDYKYLKTPPEFTLADITSARDHNGQEVKGEMARKFIQTLVDVDHRFGGKLQCGGTGGSWTKLFEDKGACQLRTEERRAGTSRPCCCHKNSLITPDASCIQITGAPGEAGMQQIVGSTYEEHGTDEHVAGPWQECPRGCLIKGKIIRANADRPENAMPVELGGTGTGWNWVQAPRQWRETCIESREVPIRGSQNPKWGNMPYQEYETQCSKWQKDWLCSAGSGLYNPVKEEGHFMNAPVIPDSLVFECPPDYSSINCHCPADDGNMQ